MDMDNPVQNIDKQVLSAKRSDIPSYYLVEQYAYMAVAVYVANHHPDEFDETSRELFEKYLESLKEEIEGRMEVDPV